MLNEIWIDKKYNSALDEQFYNIFDHVENVWIAGGFARRIYEYFYSTPKKIITHDRIKNHIGRLYDQNVDIDFFYSKVKDLDHTKDFMTNVIARKKAYHHSSPFADNYCFINDYGSPDIVSNKHVQLINSFFFEDISTCLDSFDFEVCKFALNKVDGMYRIYYTDQAREDNRHNRLNISKVGSPFLPARINKYSKKYRMSFSQSDNNLLKIKEYCYKIVSGKWNIDMTHVDNKYLFRQVKTLHRHKRLSKEELSIMIGMFNDVVRRPSSTNSMFYLFEEESTDWACKELLNV